MLSQSMLITTARPRMGQRYNIIYQNISIPNKDKYNTYKIEDK